MVEEWRMEVCRFPRSDVVAEVWRSCVSDLVRQDGKLVVSAWRTGSQCSCSGSGFSLSTTIRSKTS